MTKRIFRNMVLVAVIAIFTDSFLSLSIIKYYGADSLFLPILISAVAIVAVMVAAWFCARAIVRPIRDIDPESDTHGSHYAEISPLLHKISDQNAEIDRQIGELDRRSLEMELVMNNMAEGLIILDAPGRILSHNRSAARLLGEIADFTETEYFRRLTETALSGKHGEHTVRHEGEVLRLMSDPVVTEDKSGGGHPVAGAVVLILNITEQELREQLRREFTSNVSHELKTPLTTIYGISDMLEAGIVKQEDSVQFVGDIKKEAGRMISLIDDIIKLSRLDEASVDSGDADGRLPRESVELTALAAEVIEGLRIHAERKNVTLRLIGEYTVYEGVRSVLWEMIYNLCDNAVKYNRDGGQVTVSVYKNGGDTCISVEDTGIGIPAKEQSRVFERFYRVDKSHSRKIGGTGLGLSIVKHGVAYHGGTVSLSSTEGVGTKIVITL